MTKKNIRPQQVAPVQRETTATSAQSGKVVNPCVGGYGPYKPFAGDDAE